MTLFDQILLLATGLVALYLVLHFLRGYRESSAKASHDLYYLIAFAVLLVAGLLLIGLGYGILANPLVVIVATLIPLTLSAGLVAQFYPNYERSYLSFAAIGFILVAVTRFASPSGLATAILALWHSVAGLIIFAVPLVASRQDRAPGSFAMVTVGGVLIGVGGIALAFLKAGMPILSADFIFAILAPLLLLMTLSFAFGFTRGSTNDGSVAS